MRLLDLTLATPAENLALDEALLDEAEESAEPLETLRLWESPEAIVVVGRNSRVEDEVNARACRADGVPILRRTSGGCAIVAGPGSLMYAVVLSYALRPELRMLERTHQFVLGTIAAGLAPLKIDAKLRGTCDLALGDLKFSGNSLRCRRRALVYHGTLLHDFSLPLVETYLKMPPRQPDYRRDRAHGAFVTNLPVDAASLKQALIAAWQAVPMEGDWPREATRIAAKERYARDEWNLAR